MFIFKHIEGIILCPLRRERERETSKKKMRLFVITIELNEMNLNRAEIVAFVTIIIIVLY